MKKRIVFALVCALLLSGCNVMEPPVESTGPTEAPTVGPEDGPTGPGVNVPPSVKVDFQQNDEYLFSDRDSQIAYSEDNCAVITLGGTTVTSNAPSVLISGSTATITKEGNYILRGQLTDGSIVINANEKAKIQLILEGASITSTNSAALNIVNAKKVFLTLAEGTENALSNGGSFLEDTGVDGALFSKSDVTINGNGSLKVTSPAGHGIVCKDDLAITGGKITVHSASHGLDANDSVRIKGGDLTIDSGKDGVHVEDADKTDVGFVYISGGSVKVESEGDGLSAALYMQLSGGTIDILAGGGYENGQKHSSDGWGDFMGGGMMPPPGGQRPPRPKATTTESAEDVASMKGLKAGTGLLINGGSISIDSADDAIHSNTVMVIDGGELQIASGDDGIHADTSLAIRNGTVQITQSYEGLEAQHIVVSGGDISLVSTDDGLNAAGGVDGSGEGGRDQMTGGRPGANSNGSVTISGGKLYVKASGDGIDTNGYLQITGGYTVVCGPNHGDTATLDFDTTGTITGGVFIGTGSSMMAQTFSSNTQGVLAINAGAQAAGAVITVKDADGKEMLNYQPELPFNVFIYSAPELVSGQTYHLIVGTAEGDMAAK